MSEFRLILMITGCLMLQPLSTDLYLASLPALADEFAAPAVLVQQTLVFFSIGFALAQLFAGPLSDRYGRRPLLVGGLAFYVLASLACALAPGIYGLIAARFAQACGCCAAIVTARAIIRDRYPPALGAQKIAQASSYMAFAVVSGPIVGAQLQVRFGWPAAFVCLAGLAAVVLVAVWCWLAESKPPGAAAPAGRPGRDYAAIFRDPVFRAYTLVGALSYGGIFVYIAGSAFVLIKVLGVSTGNYGYCFATGCVGYLGGSFLCRRLLPRLGLERTLLAGATAMLLGSLGFLVLAAGGLVGWQLLVLFQFLAMFAHGVIFPCAQIGSLAPFPHRAGAAAGLFGACSMGGALAVGNLVGLTLDGTVLPLARLAAGVGVLLAIAAAAGFRRGALRTAA